jgi:hypothetical protein
MKQTRFSETQIMQILKQAEGGVPVGELYTHTLTCKTLDLT